MRRIATALMGTLLSMAATFAVLAQSAVSPPTKTAVAVNGLVADLYLPADSRTPLPAVIVLGGSRGGLDDRTAWEAKTLAEHGYAALHLGYLVGPGLPPSAKLPTAIHLIPLEYFKTAIDWLRAQPGVDPGRIGVMGTSIGGMVALLMAANYPELKAVVAAVPSSVVWSTFGSSRTSMFSRDGQPLPYLPYGTGRGTSTHNLFDDGLNSVDQYPDAVIPVERINGPVMVICGSLDSLWPSCRMSAQVIDRLKANNVKHAFQLIEYSDAGHSVLGPPVASDSPFFAALGGVTGNAARVDSWPKAVNFIDAVLMPGKR